MTSSLPPGPDTIFEDVNPLLLLESLFQKHGEIVRYQTRFGATTLVNEPAAVRGILYNAEAFPRSQVLPVVLGNGLLASEGEYWRLTRKRYQPKFHPTALETYADQIAKEAEVTLAEWEQHCTAGTVLELNNEMLKYSLRVASRIFLGDDVGTGKANQALCDATSQIINFLGHMGNTLPMRYNAEDNKRQRTGLGLLDRVIAQFVERRRSRPPGDDLLGALLYLTDDDGKPVLDTTQLRDEVATMLLGGHETTSVSMTWAMWELAIHPEVVDDLIAAEWDGLLGGRRPGWVDLPAMAKTQSAVREILRVHPPVWSLVRKVTATSEVGGYMIPGGENVLVSPYLLHRHPGVWDAPLEFRADRFLQPITREQKMGGYIPFGAGSHQCIGQHVANMELMISLPMLLRRFRVVPLDSSDPGGLPLVTLRPARPIPFRLERRPL